MKYYHCLGYKENSLLDDYMQKYIGLLAGYSRSLGMMDIANNNDFLQIPDVSTTLEGYHASRITPTVAIEFLSLEYKKFRENQYASLFSQEGHRIPSTNILLTLSDKNPDSTLDTHPGHKKTGVRTEWGNTPISEWVNLYEKAFNLLRKISPDFDYELSRIIKKIIPLGESQSSHNSASYSLCIGHLYMSYPTHIEFPELAILDAIIHESNHNKMNLIIKQDPLILNDKREIYYSPYRPDPRHIHGVYLGLHALTAVSYIFLQAITTGALQLSDAWIEKILTYHIKNALSIRTLERYGIFSELGKNIFREMRDIHNETSRFIQVLGVSSMIRNSVAQGIKEHFFSVRNCFPDIYH